MAGSLSSRHDHITLKSATNYSSAGKNRFVMQSGSLAVLSGAREHILGVLLNDPKSNEIATIDISAGLMKVVSGGSINQGAHIISDASGRAVAATPIEGAIASGNTGAFAAGTAIEKVTTSGQLIMIAFAPKYIVI